MEQPVVFWAGAGSAELCYPTDFFPQENFTGEHDLLHARTLLLEWQERMAIVSLELPSIRPYELIDDIKQLVSEVTQAPVQNIWVSVTHNLSAPHVPNKQQQPNKHDMHMSAIRDAVRQSCLQASATLQPARIGHGTGECSVNTNRDVLTSAGWWLGTDGDGPVDRTLNVWRFEGNDGKPIGFIYHYAVKSSVMEDAAEGQTGRYSTGDLTGAASRYIEQAFGVPALFLMGAAGDQVPREKAAHCCRQDSGEPVYIQRGVEMFRAVDALGAELGQEVVAIAQSLICTAEQSSFKLERSEYLLPGQQPYSGGKPYIPTTSYPFVPADPQTLTVDRLSIGQTVLLGMKPEATAKIGITVRLRCTTHTVVLVSMVNGGKDYLADAEAYNRLSFSATHSDFACGAAELFVEQAVAIENFQSKHNEDGED